MSIYSVFGSGHSLRVTHKEIFTIVSFLAFHYGTMDIGNQGVSARNIVLEFGNNGAGFHDVVTNVGNDFMRASWRRRR